MSSYISSRVKKLDIGISGYTDNTRVLDVIGNCEVLGQVDITGVGSATIFSNPNTILIDSTIPDNHNANSWGPITIADGVTVIVGDFSTWTIR